MNLTLRLVLLLCIAALASSCDETPVEPEPEPGPSIAPRVGSTFTYREFLIDENGREVAGTSRIVVATVTDSAAAHAGKSGLTVIDEGSVRYYLKYDATGDVYFHAASSSTTDTTWEKWPLKSRQTSFTSVPDTTLAGGATAKTVLWAMFDGSSTTVTPAGTFRIHTVITTRMLIDRASSEVYEESEVKRWYAPNIGVEAKSTTDASIPPLSSIYRRIKELQSYTLR